VYDKISMTSPPTEAYQSSSGGRAVTSRHAILILSSTETPECHSDIHEGPPNLAESNGRRGRAQALTVVRRAIQISLNLEQKTRQSHRNRQYFEGFFIHCTRSNDYPPCNGAVVMDFLFIQPFGSICIIIACEVCGDHNYLRILALAETVHTL
jgi:hypothetical protein